MENGEDWVKIFLWNISINKDIFHYICSINKQSHDGLSYGTDFLTHYKTAD
jgi:hypothetical protein